VFLKRQLEAGASGSARPGVEHDSAAQIEIAPPLCYDGASEWQAASIMVYWRSLAAQISA